MRKGILFSLIIILIASCILLVSCRKQPKDEPVIKGYGEGDIVISVFWPPMKGYATEEQFDLLVEAGIDLLEWGTDPIFSNDETIAETLRLCNEKGLKITICDEDFKNILKMQDNEIVELVKRYKDNECVVGFYMKDEPLNANPYGRVARIMTDMMPRCITQLNMYPMNALPDAKAHAEDWINAAGRENLRYLSFDQYPFGLQPGSVPQMFPNMDLVWRTGLKYDVDTALYIQSIGVIGSFRRPTVSETRYHTSAALAYGFKNLKYFTWFTPTERSEEFTNAIVTPDGQKSDTFDGIAQINSDIKKVSKILGNLDALEIYHNGRVDAATTMLQPGWYIENTDKKDFLVSLMVDRNDGRNYIMVVNKNFKDDVTLNLKVNGVSNLTDITSGTEEAVTITDTTFDCSLVAGGFRLYRLEEGVSLQKEYVDASDTNLAFDKPVMSTSSIGENGYYTSKAVDGIRVFSNASKGWKYEGKGGEEVYITVDLKRPVDINRVDIYPAGKDDKYGEYFPRKFTILYSNDGKNFKELVKDTYEAEKTFSYKFDVVKARYVKIRVDELVATQTRIYAEIAEIEIYNDDGTIPAYQDPSDKDKTLKPEYNVALNKTTKVSSSLEQTAWGWSKKFLNDGITTRTDTHSGWTSQIKKHDDPATEEWAMVDLGSAYNIDTVVLYPEQHTGSYFPKHLVIEVSDDGKNWTVVAENKEPGIAMTTERIIKFNAVDTRYVRVFSKEMTKVDSSPDGYLFQLAEFEVYRTGRS